MRKPVFLYCLFVCNVIQTESLGIFHEQTKITFRPDDSADYFGYSVLLNDSGLFVGAPKARSRVNRQISPGLVFSCPLETLDAKNISCRPFGTDVGNSRFLSRPDFLQDQIWFGAVIALIPTGKLLICAPRWSIPYRDTHFLMNGACYIQGQRRGEWLFPLKEMKSSRRACRPRGVKWSLQPMDIYIQPQASIERQAFMTDGKRKEYGEYGLNLNFYAYGQAGMSAKVTEANTLILGAPGLLQWTGGISEYMLYPDFESMSVHFGLRTTTNPYNTKDIGPDDYLGYSVESGIFDTSGKALYVAGAPRAEKGYGQVLIFEQSFRETDDLKIKARVTGPHLGSYFGATVACIDVNGDDVVDLLVGAPTYVHKGGGLPYDQGAVFIYLTERFNTSFVLNHAGFVSGSQISGARFGTAIANLGDIDGDGYNEIAIGAPWENEGIGAVYVYKGSRNGIRKSFAQKITAEGAKTFGISISKGLDVDSNNCNDLAVGAYKTGAAYIFRCIPTMQVFASIVVPDATNLPQNATNFTALFCVNTPEKKMWPYVKIGLKAKITVDPDGNRARISGEDEYGITIKPGNNACEEETVEIVSTKDLSKPISIKFTLDPVELMKDDSPLFIMNAARLSEDSVLHSSFDIQLTRGCGEDLICRPLLVLTLEPMVDPYVPGSDNKLGFSVKVLNKEEPAYGAKVYLQLPSNPVRLPSDCTFEELNVTCSVPSPLYRGEAVTWDIELEFTLKGIVDKQLKVFAKLEDPFHKDKNGSIDNVLIIAITPKATFRISSKALPNTTIAVTRDNYNAAGSISLVHYYEVTNFGPSDWYRLSACISLPDKVNLTNTVKGCSEGINECIWSLPAKVSMPIILPLRFDIGLHKNILEEKTSLNITSKVILMLEDKNQSISTTTTLVLDPDQPLWPLIVGLIAGFSLLAAIVFALYKYGFFSRTSRDELKRLQEQSLLLEDSSPSSAEVTSSEANESTQELVVDDSD